MCHDYKDKVKEKPQEGRGESNSNKVIADMEEVDLPPSALQHILHAPILPPLILSALLQALQTWQYFIVCGFFICGAPRAVGMINTLSIVEDVRGIEARMQMNVPREEVRKFVGLHC